MCKSRASGILRVEERGGNISCLLRGGVRGFKPAIVKMSSSVVGVGGHDRSESEEAAADGDIVGIDLI